METKVYTVPEIKTLFLETLLNKVDGKVTKISDHSVLNGVAYGVAKILQRSMKDSALIESELFPDYAYGKYLDKIVERSGITPRAGGQGSSVYVRVVATPGTIYLSSECDFISTSGYIFRLLSDFTVGDAGFGYTLLRSVDIGSNTNVPSNSITRITNKPSGHKFVINEVEAFGGIDLESDTSLLGRSSQNFNNFASDTLSKIKAVFSKINPLILDVKKIGINSSGGSVLGIVTTNGVDLTESEIDLLISKSKYYLSLTDQSVSGNLSTPSISIQNIQYTYIDIDFRVELYNSTDIDSLRKTIQYQLLQYLDFRLWNKIQVDWEELFYIIRGQEGVKSLPEQFFIPHLDIPVSKTSLPRLRGFIMRSLGGDVILDNSNNIVPLYYTDQYNLNILNQINSNYGQ